MADSRVEAYARLLVERCVGVKPGWQVVINSTPLARELLEEVARNVARRGAYAFVRSAYATIDTAWVNEAPESLLGDLPPIERYLWDTVNAAMYIGAPENTRDGSDVSPERRSLIAKANEPRRKRMMLLELPWVVCQFPTPALAQDAGMTLGAYQDFLYGACLLDWDEEGRKMQRIADRFNRANLVRVIGADTDLSFSLAGRTGEVDDGHYNMPGGEVFYSPVEDSAEGTITFGEYPAVLGGYEVEGARLVFHAGRVVDATARVGEQLLIKLLDTDPGARVLGEFGIGCNPGIQRHMKSTLFDEKINGTVHFAVGQGFPHVGGTNQSALHWDMVKDLRPGGQILCDGEVVQENGVWRI